MNSAHSSLEPALPRVRDLLRCFGRSFGVESQVGVVGPGLAVLLIAMAAFVWSLPGARDVRAGLDAARSTTKRTVIGIVKEGLAPTARARSSCLLIDAHSYKSAATELRVTLDTIRFHIRHIYDKLRVHPQREAVAKALRLGLFS